MTKKRAYEMIKRCREDLRDIEDLLAIPNTKRDAGLYENLEDAINDAAGAVASLYDLLDSPTWNTNTAGR